MEITHGFDYWPELTLSNRLADVAKFIRISAPAQARAPLAAAARNDRYTAGLSEKEMDRYALALSGETSHDGHSALSPSDVGESETEFPAGGCIAKADRRVLGIWEAVRPVEDEWHEIFPELNRRHPIGRRDAERYEADRVDLEQRLVAKHRVLLENARRRYANAVEEMRADSAFVEALRQHIVLMRQNDGG